MERRLGRPRRGLGVSWCSSTVEPAAGSTDSPGVQYFTAWLLEKSLSVDNLFVFALIFAYFKVPAKYQHRVLFFGVIGALRVPGRLPGPGRHRSSSASPRCCSCSRRSCCTAPGSSSRATTTTTTRPTSFALRAMRKVIPMKERVRRQQVLHQGGRQALRHAAARRRRRHRGRRPGVRRRQRARGAGGELGRVHRLHLERLRHPRPARPVLPARRAARPLPPPRPGSRDHPRLHRRQADPAGQPRELLRRPSRRSRRWSASR